MKEQAGGTCGTQLLNAIETCLDDMESVHRDLAGPDDGHFDLI